MGTFCAFTQNQIRELAANYGKLDIMWFDAGWVCPQAGQDIRLGEVIEEIRRWQPGMLCADRTVGGPYENYITPEQCVPEERWECHGRAALHWEPPSPLPMRIPIKRRGR